MIAGIPGIEFPRRLAGRGHFRFVGAEGPEKPACAM
jgi:hypothetical protein